MVKFTATFHSTLEFGHVIIVGGRLTAQPEKFTLNLLTDEPRYDIPFHMDFVFGDESRVIRNTKINGDFGTPETMPGMFTKQSNPLVAGEKFVVYMLIGLDRFHISINNIHFCDYIFRSSVKRVTSLQLVHDVERVSQFDHRAIFPFSFPVYQTRLLQNLTFSCDTPKPFKEGSVVELKGRVDGNSSGSFTLKFLVGRSEQQSFHMDVRFATRKVYRNHSVNELVELVDSEAETYGGFPFEFERVFKIAIGFDALGVQVAINGKFFCEYPYKARLSSYSGLKIREKNGMVLHVLELHHRTIDKSLPSFEQLSEL